MRCCRPTPTVYPRKFDLLIVDEVHQCAPAGRGGYATDSQRTIALRKIAPHFEHRLFLSATPHNGYTESFTALLELLDPQRFARGVEPSDEAQRRDPGAPAEVGAAEGAAAARRTARRGSPSDASSRCEVEYPDAERAGPRRAAASTRRCAGRRQRLEVVARPPPTS